MVMAGVAGVAIRAVAVAFLGSQLGILMIATIAMTSAIVGSKAYELLLKDTASDFIRKTYDQQNNQQTHITDSVSSPNTPSRQMPDASGGILAGIGGFFDGLANRIGGFMGLGGSNSGSLALASGPFGFGRIGFDPGGDLEKLFSQGIDKFTDKLADRLTKNDNILNNALGTTLMQNSGLFTDLIRKGRLGDLTGGLEDLFSSKNIGDVFGNFIGNAAAAGVGKLLGVGRVRTRVTSQESERSRKASRNWNPSRSQQAAMLAQMVQQGSKNL